MEIGLGRIPGVVAQPDPKFIVRDVATVMQEPVVEILAVRDGAAVEGNTFGAHLAQGCLTCPVAIVGEEDSGEGFPEIRLAPLRREVPSTIGGGDEPAVAVERRTQQSLIQTEQVDFTLDGDGKALRVAVVGSQGTNGAPAPALGRLLSISGRIGGEGFGSAVAFEP